MLMKKKKDLRTMLKILSTVIPSLISVTCVTYYHNLSIAGNCRVCLVELKNLIKLIVSCVTAKSALYNNDMYHDSALIKKARKNINKISNNKKKLKFMGQKTNPNIFQLEKINNKMLKYFKKKHTVKILLKFFESRLDPILYRFKISLSIKNARQLILHGKILVNNKTIKFKNITYKLKKNYKLCMNTSLKTKKYFL